MIMFFHNKMKNFLPETRPIMKVSEKDDTV